MLSVLKIFMILGFIVLNFFLFPPAFFKIFHSAVMIYNTRNRINYATESQKEKKICFNAHSGRKPNLTLQCIVSKQIKCGYFIKSLVI